MARLTDEEAAILMKVAHGIRPPTDDCLEHLEQFEDETGSHLVWSANCRESPAELTAKGRRLLKEYLESK